MLDIGWSELLLIGVVALIVIGPKDLPHLFHSLGRFMARARSMAREFTSAMEDAAKSSGLDDAASTLRDVKSMTSKKALGLDALDRAAERFEKWEPKLPGSRDMAPKPDPGAVATAKPAAKPAAARSPAAKATAPAAQGAEAGASATAEPAATSVAAAAGTPAPAQPAVGQPAAGQPAAKQPAAKQPAGPGQRRIRAVRRSDTKEG